MNHEYFVLRAIPDRIRGECINVGIVAFFHDRPLVFVGAEQSRLRSLHPSLGEVDPAAWGRELEVELAKLDSKATRLFMLGAMRGAIVPTERAGYVSAENLDELHARIQGLMKRLVATPERAFRPVVQPQGESRSTLHSQLRTWFRAAHVFSPRVSDLSKGKVVAGYPIVADEDLYADFALMNGAIHVIETMDLRGVDKVNKTLRGEAGWKSVLLDQARRTLSTETRRIAVVSADDYKVVRPLIAMVERYADDLITIESSADRQRLANFVATSLHLKEGLEESFELAFAGAEPLTET